MTKPHGIFARKRTPFEWIVLAVSVASILVMVSGLLLQGSRGRSDSADLKASIRESGEGSGGVTYEVTVVNRGGVSAHEVLIEVTSGEIVREVLIRLVGKQDEETAVVVLPPDAADPTVEVSSYVER